MFQVYHRQPYHDSQEVEPFREHLLYDRILYHVIPELLEDSYRLLDNRSK